MNNSQPKRIQKPLSQTQLAQMVKKNEGFINVIVGIELDTLIDMENIDEFNTTIDNLVINEGSWASLGYAHGLDYEACGFDKQTKQILIHITADLDPEFYEDEEDLSFTQLTV